MQEFADFLGSQPPFDALSADDLTRLARQVEVEYFAAGTVIVPADAQPLDHLYVIRTGAVEISDRGRTVDLLGPGDTFGHISVLTGLPPALSARAAEDTLCYRLPDPRKAVTDPSALQFSHFGTMIAHDLCRSKNRTRVVTCASSEYQAAGAYSLIRPPRTGFRRIRLPSRSAEVR